MTADMLKVGERAYVVSIDDKLDIKQRLIDLGLIPNTQIECVLESPWNDPKAFMIRGAVIAIRNEDLKGIHIKKDVL